ncbi:MAG: ParA family protein [Peptostreptococcaceae bacterium]|nr:ParA family protein [Peptostreptococcaceae bacterium]
MAKIIFFGNHKGGVGKTTTTFQVGANMAKLGKKVLLIDLDPQGSLSKICVKMVNIKNTNDIPVERTLNYLLEL